MIGDSQANPLASFDARLKAIQRDWVAPLLRSHGFQKGKKAYEKGNGSMAWIVSVQQSRWNDAEEAQFTLNCGVYIQGVTSAYLNRPDPAHIGLTNCCIHARIGMLANDNLDKWWKLQADDDVPRIDHAIGEELSFRLTQHVLPFLNRFQTPDEVWRFLTARRAAEEKFIWPQSEATALCFAAVVASLLGRPQEMGTCLENAIVAARGTAVEDVVERVKDSLEAE